MKKSIMISLLGMLLVFTLVLAGCGETVSGNSDVQSADGDSQVEAEEAEETADVTGSGDYAYLEEKGLTGEDLECAISLNEKYGMIYEEQIIIYCYPALNKEGIVAYDEPLAIAIDVSEFKQIHMYRLTQYDYEYISDLYYNLMMADIDGDGEWDVNYDVFNDNVIYKDLTYSDYLENESYTVIGTMEEDVKILIGTDNLGNHLIWGHENDANSFYRVDADYALNSPTYAEHSAQGREWLIDKITILTTPNAIYE